MPLLNPQPTIELTTWPTKEQRITQGFGANHYFDYRTFGLPGHEGVDIAAEHGSPIFAAATGIVSHTITDPKESPYGQHIRIMHQAAYETLYAHLSSITVQQDQLVQTGEIIGEAGSTGRSTGPHLHFGMRSLTGADGTASGYPNNIIDPTPYLNALLDKEVITETGAWVHTNFLTFAGSNIISGQYGLTIRQQPDMNSRNLGFIPANLAVQIYQPEQEANGYIRIIIPPTARAPHPLAYNNP